MDDNKQYTNEGTIVGAEDKTSIPSTEPTLSPSPIKPRRTPWNRIALALILIGIGMFATGWISGSRGGSIVLEGGRLRIATAGNENIITNMGISNSTSITEIYINTTSAAVVIVPTHSQNQLLNLQLTNLDPTIDYSGNRLSIDTRNTESTRRIQLISFGFTSFRREIRLEIPQDQMDSIRITSTSGRIRIEDVNAAHIETRASSGNIRLNNVQAETLNARSSSGTIRGENLNFYDGHLQSSSGRINMSDISWYHLNVQTSSGRILVTDADIRQGETRFQSSSGSTTLNVRRSQNGLHYTLSTNSGSIRTNDQRASRGTIEGGNGDSQVSIRTSSGSIRLEYM